MQQRELVFKVLYYKRIISLDDRDELADRWDTISNHVNNIRTWWAGVLVWWHGDGDSLRSGASNETSVVKEQHPVAHVDTVCNETTIVK